MVNTIYNDINAKIIALMKLDAEFSDIGNNYFPYTKTLETSVFPCVFVVKTNRETNPEEINEGMTEDTLAYNVEIYYRSDHGSEDLINAKDHALKAIFKANKTLGGLVSDSQCYSSSTSSSIIVDKILTVLSAKVDVFLDE